MKTLLQKLGWRDGTASAVWNPPAALPPELAALASAADDAPTFLIGFAPGRAEVAELAGGFAGRYPRGGHLWICYPKKSGRIASDLSRDQGWEPITALGFLPVTQVAVDEDWSALRFRYRDEIPVLRRKGG